MKVLVLGASRSTRARPTQLCIESLSAQFRHERFMAVRPEWMPVRKSIACDLFTGDEQNVMHGGPVGCL
jgi:hypothetical protein